MLPLAPRTPGMVESKFPKFKACHSYKRVIPSIMHTLKFLFYQREAHIPWSCSIYWSFSKKTQKSRESQLFLPPWELNEGFFCTARWENYSFGQVHLADHPWKPPVHSGLQRPFRIEEIPFLHLRVGQNLLQFLNPNLWRGNMEGLPFMWWSED